MYLKNFSYDSSKSPTEKEMDYGLMTAICSSLNSLPGENQVASLCWNDPESSTRRSGSYENDLAVYLIEGGVVKHTRRFEGNRLKLVNFLFAHEQEEGLQRLIGRVRGNISSPFPQRIELLI